MASLSDIKKPVAAEMREFESYFRHTLQSDIPFFHVILDNFLRRKGKQMRPLLVFLTARLNGKVNETTYIAATFIELLHTATLVHDDVVDDASERRGLPSINVLYNSKIAVLVGDYLLAQGLLISVEKQRFNMLGIVSDAVREIVKGELVQLQKTRKLDIREEDYFRIIKMKTAALISACTACGASSVTDDPDAIARMKEMGENIGIAFQIKDDLLDYTGEGLTGKREGNDIKEKKITLPLIHALRETGPIERRHIIRLLRKKKKGSREIREVIGFVKKHGGLDYAEAAMKEYSDRAIRILEEYPDSETKSALIEFVIFSTLRRK
ncbi:MAG: polyprenyl synthetase family protein [Bacteroidales bacterium]|jgi:octaprenyl-diphosphate synthase|nr:polyprenyl synthetase family protein [Bacteroidales bacterium]MDX9926650.1 polyprenyl synthetase family protein [Bacteroidales bacterium]HNX83383.1 polyprenyl synthetase family protein [Bacteroidales bacterium]HOC47191.1 polyprenyl synthetase family protein [Bacteroidales bacterium]HPS97005.1 polyprenyl synthetase family protein [Bacteroidales bacterium]